VNKAREFLYDLTDPKKTPKVPKVIREQAFRILKHYPNKYYLDRSAETSPDIWEKEND
jgi:hypothetical protein